MDRNGATPVQSFDIAATWPEDGLQWLGYCPVCGSRQRQLLHEGLQDRVFFCAPGKWTLYGCQICGCAYLDPRPTPEMIALAYARYFTHADQSTEKLSFLRRLQRAMGNGYRNRKYDTTDHPAFRVGYMICHALPLKKAEIDARMRHLPPVSQGRRLLDVGCGNGEFLVRARSAGWQVTGIEPDPLAVKIARANQLDVRQGSIDVLEEHSKLFDIITLSHVIEHVHDPMAMLMHCHRLLKPGGKIWIETPNLDSQGHHRFGGDWRGLEPPRHLVLFSRASLWRALENTGFKEIKDAPFRPLCGDIFLQSKAIVLHKDPMKIRNSILHHYHYFGADAHAWRHPKVREFVNLVARKPL